MLHRYDNCLNFKANAPVGYRFLGICRASLRPENFVWVRDYVVDSYAVGVGTVRANRRAVSAASGWTVHINVYVWIRHFLIFLNPPKFKN